MNPLPFLLAALLGAPAGPESFLHRYAETRRFAAGLPTEAVLTPEGDAAVFLRSGPRSRVQSLFVTDLHTSETRELASAEALLTGGSAAPTAEERAQLERQRVSAGGITGFQMSKDGKRIVAGLGGKLFLVDRVTGAVALLRTGGRPAGAAFSPDGRTLSYVRDHDLWLLDLERNEERRLTSGGTEDVSHGTAEFVAEEELNRFEGYWWSPDSSSIAYQETDQREVERFTILDPLHPERPADVFRYPRAGTANARVRIGVVPASGGATTWIDWDRERHPYVADVVWPERGPLSLVVLNRRQTEELLLAADPATGRTRVLVSERDERWVDPRPRFPRWLSDGSAFFWATQRLGAWSVELRGADGAFRGTWIGPERGFQTSVQMDSLVGYDGKRRRLWYIAAPDPRGNGLYSVTRGEAPEAARLPGRGSPAAASLSRNGETILVRWTSFEEAGPEVAYRTDGTRLAELPSAAERPPFATAAEIRKVGPGQGLWTLLVRPRTFEKGRKLPVIVRAYGGPGVQMVHVGPRLLDQWIADQGYLVVSVDGRGTPGRGREWARSIQGDFAGPVLEDQVSGLRALAAEVPEMDLSRVGIWGGSFGGYLAALAVMRRPDVFRAAVALAPVTEWRDYDTAYTERYLGLPQEAPLAYQRSSLLGQAATLERPLLLIHGTADDNVYFFHSLKLADALIHAGRRYELLPIPGRTHQLLGGADPVLTERILERVVRHFRENL